MPCACSTPISQQPPVRRRATAYLLLPPIFATKPLEMIGQLRDGDVVVVWKLDRLSRSLKDMLHIMERIELAGAGIRSLTEAIANTTEAGRLMKQLARKSVLKGKSEYVRVERGGTLKNKKKKKR